jgi:CrcB protein
LSWLAVGFGAVFGAWFRWGLSTWMPSWQGNLPLGTLLANLGGGYLIGMAVAFFHAHPSLPPEWRLFLITGFLGGLTTFSTFSVESMLLLQRGDYLWALLHTALHVLGALALCIAGFATWRAITA